MIQGQWNAGFVVCHLKILVTFKGDRELGCQDNIFSYMYKIIFYVFFEFGLTRFLKKFDSAQPRLKYIMTRVWSKLHKFLCDLSLADYYSSFLKNPLIIQIYFSKVQILISFGSRSSDWMDHPPHDQL